MMKNILFVSLPFKLENDTSVDEAMVCFNRFMKLKKINTVIRGYHRFTLVYDGYLYIYVFAEVKGRFISRDYLKSNDIAKMWDNVINANTILTKTASSRFIRSSVLFKNIPSGKYRLLQFIQNIGNVNLIKRTYVRINIEETSLDNKEIISKFIDFISFSLIDRREVIYF